MDQGLEAQGPGTGGPLSLHLQAPPQGTAHSSSHWGRAGERGAGPCGEGPGERPSGGHGGDPPTALPPEAAHMILCKRSIWLRSGCSVCKGSLGPPAALRHIIAKGIPPSKVPPVPLRPQVSSNGSSQRRRIQAEGAPLSHGTEMQMDGHSAKKAKGAPV